MIALILLLAAQEGSTTIRRNEKEPYLKALKACREAAEKIDSEPQAAIDALTEALKGVKHVECRLRIEQRPGDFDNPVDFYPHQLRGRARMALAAKRPADAESLLRDAIDDLKRSPESARYLKEAEAALEKFKSKPVPPAEDAAAKVRPAWRELVDTRKYKSAIALLEGKGLTDAQRKVLVDDTESACRSHLVEQASAFRRKLPRSVRETAELTDDEFAAKFALPAPDEMVVAVPALDWARALLPALRKPSVDALLASAAAAAPLEEKDENPWFKASELLAFGAARDAASAAVSGAADAASAERARLRADVDALLGRWKEFESKLDAKFRERHAFVAAHSKELAALPGGFPKDLAELDAVDIESCFAKDAAAELRKVESSLKALEGRTGVTRESRQSLYTLLVTAGALQTLLKGESEDAAASAVAAYGPKLAAVGGAVEPARFGPRVERVFERLRK